MDSLGFMWIGTNVGLKRYDGYEMKVYGNTLSSPNVLPHNEVFSLTGDRNNGIWIGTKEGLVRYDTKKDIFQKIPIDQYLSQTIYTLFTDKGGRVWIGKDQGLYYFDTKTSKVRACITDTTQLICLDGSRKKMPKCKVKSIVEDSKGNLYIAASFSGLFRYDIHSNTFYQYPPIKSKNTVFSLCLDYKDRLWVGTWGEGVSCIENPMEMGKLRVLNFPYTEEFNTYYRISEDMFSHTLWLSSRGGLTLIDLEDTCFNLKHYKNIDSLELSFCRNIISDNFGHVWLATAGNGIFQFSTQRPMFNYYHPDFSLQKTPIKNINAIYTWDGVHFLIAPYMFGLAIFNKEKNITLFNQGIPWFHQLPSCFFQERFSDFAIRGKDELWMANWNGIAVMDISEGINNIGKWKFKYSLPGCAKSLAYDKNGNMWVGMSDNLLLIQADNTKIFFDQIVGVPGFLSGEIQHILVDSQQNLWLSTSNRGIIKISNISSNKLANFRYAQYASSNKKLLIDNITSTFEDSKGRFWAISQCAGLFLYDSQKDIFVSCNKKYNINSECLLSMGEDKSGNLWLTSDKALIRLSFYGDKCKTYYFRCGGALWNAPIVATCSYNYNKQLYFANQKDIFALNISQADTFQTISPKLVVTNIFLDDKKYEETIIKEKSECQVVNPSYIKELIIPYGVSRVEFEFALLTFSNASQNRYACFLKGYDNDWQHLPKHNHSVLYRKLPPGKYEMFIRAVAGVGKWTYLPYTIKIEVLPPWWASWWFYTICILVSVSVVILIIRIYFLKIKVRNRLRLVDLLTNITHEMLTPLTIISASVDELNRQVPQQIKHYKIIQDNVSRFSRLLRQILEVQKVELGKLRLEVSSGNICSFFTTTCENFQDVAHRKNISYLIDSPLQEVNVYFDPDKLEKILYNLLSNAFKYSREGGLVKATLRIEKNYLRIFVEDTGIGMSEKQQKHLYQRFFDGDYRKTGALGTGIGLSLTYDLVKLCHGEIECKSALEKGTAFVIKLPICKSAFKSDEISLYNTINQKTKETRMKDSTSQNCIAESVILNEKHDDLIRMEYKHTNYRILIVEDNDDLLNIMKRLLEPYFMVITAHNGLQAWNLLQKESLDIVVSDVMMPQMNGMELTQKIKNHEGYKHLPVILLTAKCMDEDKDEAFRIGADEYLTKPFRLNSLLLRIFNIIENRLRIRQRIFEDNLLTEASLDNENHLTNPDQIFLDKAYQCVKKNLNDPSYGREALAADLCMSGSSLYARIRMLTGNTIVGFILQIRLREACRILEKYPNTQISEVSEMVGFNSPNYFTRCFKKELGILPNEYARKNKRGVNQN